MINSPKWRCAIWAVLLIKFLMMKQMILMSIALMLMLVACKEKETDLAFPLDQFPEDFKWYQLDTNFTSTFMAGGEGSKWIYYDSTQQVYDTFCIVNGDHNVGSVSEETEFLPDGNSARYESSRGAKYLTMTLSNGPNAPPYIDFHDMLYGSGDMIFKYPDGSYGTKGSQPDPSSGTEFRVLPSFEIDGQVYTDVVEFTDVSIQIKRIIFAKGVGVIFQEILPRGKNIPALVLYLKHYELTPRELPPGFYL